jgi:hypothetical protein
MLLEAVRSLSAGDQSPLHDWPRQVGVTLDILELRQPDVSRSMRVGTSRRGFEHGVDCKE